MVQEEKSRTTKRRKEKGEDFFAFVRDIISIVCLYPSRVSIFNYRDLLEVQKNEDFDKTLNRHRRQEFFLFFSFSIFIMCNQHARSKKISRHFTHEYHQRTSLNERTPSMRSWYHQSRSALPASSSSSSSSSPRSVAARNNRNRNKLKRGVVARRIFQEQRDEQPTTIDDGMPSKDEEQDAIEKSDATLEKDKFKKLVYEPQGYVLQTVEEGTSGERVTIEVGPTDEEKSQRKFLFRKVLSTESTIIAYEAQRPLGIVFEVDTSGFLRVVDFNPTSEAYQRDAIQRLQPATSMSQSPAIGDVLRGFTAVSIKYGPRAALLGDLSGTKRMVVTYGVDNQETRSVFKALASGTIMDGPMTLVLERAKDPNERLDWKPEEIPIEKVRRDAERKQISVDDGLSTANATFLALGGAFLLLLLAGFS